MDKELILSMTESVRTRSRCLKHDTLLALRQCGDYTMSYAKELTSNTFSDRTIYTDYDGHDFVLVGIKQDPKNNISPIMVKGVYTEGYEETNDEPISEEDWVHIPLYDFMPEQLVWVLEEIASDMEEE